MRQIRTITKTSYSPDDLAKIEQEIHTKQDVLRLQYEPLLHNQTSTPEIVGRMNTCATLTEETSALESNQRETIDENYNDQLEKERMRTVLNKEEYRSVFGHTNHRNQTTQVHSTVALANS